MSDDILAGMFKEYEKFHNGEDGDYEFLLKGGQEIELLRGMVKSQQEIIDEQNILLTRMGNIEGGIYQQIIELNKVFADLKDFYDK